MSSIQNTPWKDLSKIKNLFKLDFPVATFEIFSFFQSLPLKQWKQLKSGHREIQFQQLIVIAKIFWIEAIQGYPNIDSYFAFDNFICVWKCIKVEQKNTSLPTSQVQGLLWTSLTSAIIFFQVISQIQKV